MWNGGSAYNHHHPPPQGSYPHPPHRPQQEPCLNEMNWEELYDSGQLEIHLTNQLTLRPPAGGGAVHINHPPPHPHQFMYSPSAVSPQPLMSIVTRPPPPIVPPRMVTMRGNGEFPQCFPPNFSQPPPPIHVPQRLMKRPQIFRPKQSNKTALTPIHSSTSDIFEEVEIVSDHPRTQYRPPEPKVKILKRPSSTPSNLSSQEQQQQQPPPQQHIGTVTILSPTEKVSGASSPGSSSDRDEGKGNFTKSLKQREEEYAQARLRIMGSAEPVDEEAPTEDAPSSSDKTSSNSDTVSLAFDGTTRNSSSNVLRPPKGPDGTKGFELKR